MLVLTLAVLAATAAGLTSLNLLAGTAAGGLTAVGVVGTVVLVLWCLLPFAAMAAAAVTAHRSSPRALPVLLAGSLVLVLPVVATSTSYVDMPAADRNAMGGVFVSVALWLVVIATVAAATAVGASSPRPRRRSWRAWTPVLVAGPLCAYGVAHPAGVPLLG